jgi:hypothetical protein
MEKECVPLDQIWIVSTYYIAYQFLNLNEVPCEENVNLYLFELRFSRQMWDAIFGRDSQVRI